MNRTLALECGNPVLVSVGQCVIQTISQPISRLSDSNTEVYYLVSEIAFQLQVSKHRNEVNFTFFFFLIVKKTD